MSQEIVYVANARLPSRKAHPYQVVQMCHGFAQTGADVELVVPARRQPNDELQKPLDEYFDTPIDFDIRRLPCLDLLWLVPHLPSGFGPPIFYLQSLTFALAAFVYVLRRRSAASLVYSRALLFTMLGSLVFGDRLLVELHRRPSRDWVTRLLGRVFDSLAGIVVISEGLSEDWQEYTSAPILVAPDGVRPARFDVTATPDALRAQLDIPASAIVVTYTGSLKRWKGVDTLVRAAEHVPEDVVVYIVGGTEDQQRELRNRVTVPENVTLVGHVQPERVPAYLGASDILVLPNSGEYEISAQHTSPLKLFEYMAAGRPIVTSDLPSIREVLDEETAFFADSDDPGALGAAIDRAVTDPDAVDRARAARERVEQYSWSARAERILSFAK